jgi:hypothetical protein
MSSFMSPHDNSTSNDLTSCRLEFPEERVEVFSSQKFRKGCTEGSAKQECTSTKIPSQSRNKPIEKERERTEEPKKGSLQC